MRKFLLVVAVVMGLSATQINAQSISGGIKADANMSNFILKDMDAESTLGFGATIGGYGKIEFNENLALQPEVLLHFKNSELKSNSSNQAVDFQYFGVEIPVYAVGYINIGDGKGFLGFGPYLGLGIDARYKTSGASDVKLYKKYGDTKSAMQRWDFGIGGMLGYEFMNKFQISAAYKIGFIDALNAEADNATMLNQTVSLGVGYRF